MKNQPKTKAEQRKRRHVRVRSIISGTAERPRLAVFKSNRFISAQLIDDTAGKTIASAHGREFPGAASKQAVAVGKAVGDRAKKAGVVSAVFDRAGYSYEGQIKVLAEAAREAGLKF
jgi:large subunit ribosomal protein L18